MSKYILSDIIPQPIFKDIRYKLSKFVDKVNKRTLFGVFKNGNVNTQIILSTSKKTGKIFYHLNVSLSLQADQNYMGMLFIIHTSWFSVDGMKEILSLYLHYIGRLFRNIKVLIVISSTIY